MKEKEMLYVAICREYRAKVLDRNNLPLRAKKGRDASKAAWSPDTVLYRYHHCYR